MRINQIAGHTIIPGKIIKDHLHIHGTETNVPYVVIPGLIPGPTLLVTAGIHSAEYVGIQAAIELSQEISPEEISGTLIIIPLANRSGFENRTMSMVFEDGKNLNRVFPGDAGGTAADRLACALFDTFITHADAYIDLHSGDGYEELMPYVYFLGDTECELQSAAMADCVDAKYCVRSGCRTGGAYNLASGNGIPAILIERGELSQLPRCHVEADKRDVLNIMRMLGMISGDCRTIEKQPLEEKELFSPYTGCWYPDLHAGDKFRAGDILGTICDYFGTVLFSLVADENGIILHQCASLNIIMGGPMLSYGIVSGLSK